MRKMDDGEIRKLTQQFAELCGLPLPHPQAPAGELHDASGKLVFSWYKCSLHSTWMQPCWCGGIAHWHCAADGCGRVHPAKMRTLTERELFRLAKFLESHG